MGRPRSFDEDAAVEAAVAEFRRRGYAATSVDHLVAATGVHRGSLYGVFGSKRGLFLRGLDAVALASVARDVRLDLVLVGLLELAPTDRQVRDRVDRLCAEHDLTPHRLGERLLARARAEHPDHHQHPAPDTEESS